VRLALALVIVLSLVLAAPAAAARPKCALPSKAKVLTAGDYAVVYSVGDGPRKYRACVRRTGRKHLLQEDSTFDGEPVVRFMTVTGRYAGWLQILYDRWQQTRGSVWVYDLKRGKLRWWGEGPFRPAGQGLEFTDFALAPNGRVAYVSLEHRREFPDPDGTPSQWRSVWARDASGSRKLEEGRDAIDLTSLDIDGLTATWTSAGQSRSAQLY
jgi:hypothetical protein